MSAFQKIISSPSGMLKFSIAICYLALGVYLFINENVLYFIDKAYRYILAVVFIAYGAFRLYRAINDAKND